MIAGDGTDYHDKFSPAFYSGEIIVLHDVNDLQNKSDQNEMH